MKKTALCLIVILTFIFSFNSFSQHKDSSKVNSLTGGKWAIQFEIGSFVNPNFFESVMFSVKPQLSKHFALRFGVSYNFKRNNGDATSDGISVPEESSTDYAVGKINFQYYVNPKDKLVFYLGMGPIYNYRYEKYQNFNADISPEYTYTFQNLSSIKSWSAGLVGIVGVEWFIHYRVSFLAEYNVSATFGKYERVSTSKSSNPPFYDEAVEVDTKSYETSGFDLNIAKIGLSVYF